MFKKVKHNLPPELLYTLKYENTEFYKLKYKLLEHKHFLGGYIFGDNQLATIIEYEVECHGLRPDNEKITDFLYANHSSISNLIEKIVGEYLSEILEFIAEKFVKEHIDNLTIILGKESEELDD